MTQRFAFAALLLPLVLAGCSVQEDFYVTPDTTPPLAPVVLGATATGDAVNVWWEPNTEADLLGYYVYVSDGTSFGRANDQPTDLAFLSVPSTSSSVLIQVTAVDRSGNESAPGGTHGTVSPQQAPEPRLPRTAPIVD